jgi:PAS domain S-box-containing protein
LSQATAKFDFEILTVPTAQLRQIASLRYDDAIVILDPDGFVTTGNACAEDMYGYTAEDIVGRHFSRIGISNARPVQGCPHLCCA